MSPLKDFRQIAKLCNCQTMEKQYQHDEIRNPDSSMCSYSMTLSDKSKILAERYASGFISRILPDINFSITVINHGDLPEIADEDSVLLAWLTYLKLKREYNRQKTRQERILANDIGR